MLNMYIELCVNIDSYMYLTRSHGCGVRIDNFFRHPERERERERERGGGGGGGEGEGEGGRELFKDDLLDQSPLSLT